MKKQIVKRRSIAPNLPMRAGISWEARKRICPWHIERGGRLHLFLEDLSLAIIDFENDELTFTLHPDADVSEADLKVFCDAATKWFISAHPNAKPFANGPVEPLTLEECESLAVHGSPELRQWAILQADRSEV